MNLRFAYGPEKKFGSEICANKVECVRASGNWTERDKANQSDTSYRQLECVWHDDIIAKQ